MKLSFGKLTVIQLGVKTALFEQLVVPALLDDIAVAHNQNNVAVLDCGQAVGDNKARLALHHLGKRLLNADFGQGVNRARRLVQNQHARVSQHCPRNTQKLALTNAEVAAFLTDNRVVVLRHTADKAVCVGGFCRGDNLFVGRVFRTVTQVFHNRAAEQLAVLQNHTEAAP